MKRSDLIIFLLFILSTGCVRNVDKPPAKIVISGDTAGWIVPCGCTSNQSGGLPRRGTLVGELRKQGSVVFTDVGGAPGGTTLYDKLKFEAVLQGESDMGIFAHNIGRAEAELGSEELRRLEMKCKTPWISANTTDASGNPLAEPARLAEAGNDKILFIGVLSQRFRNENVRVTPPRQAVLKTLRNYAGRYDRAILLAYVPEGELSELAENLPEVDAVVGGPTGQPVPPSFLRGTVLTASATRQGKFLVVLTFPPNGGNSSKLRGEIVELDERFADDPAQSDNVKTFYAELKRRDLAPRETPFVDRETTESGRSSTDSFVGSYRCQTCHEDEYRVWKESRHAATWQSLVKREAQYDPDCQRCHVTGYGRQGGFETVVRSSDRYDVGCESCHGGAAEHVKNGSIPTPERAKERCVSCHDRENSPRFDIETYWTKIKHGKEPSR